MKKFIIAAVLAAVFTATAVFAATSTASADKSKMGTYIDKDCSFRTTRPARGAPLAGPNGDRHFSRDNGRAYVTVHTTGKNCKQPVALVAWKSTSEDGRPFKDQVITRYKNLVLTEGTVTIGITMPKKGCFFQIDLVRGTNPGKGGNAKYQPGRLIHAVTGGQRDCMPESGFSPWTPTTPTPEPPKTPQPPTPEVPETPETPVEEVPDVTEETPTTPDTPQVVQAVAVTPASLPKTGPASTAALFAVIVVVAAIGHTIITRRRIG